MARANRSTATSALTRLSEIAIAAPQVVAMRTSRILAAGANPRASDRAEMTRMHTEKVQAFWESIFGMAAQAGRAQQEYARLAGIQWFRLWASPLSFVGRRTPAQAAVSLLPVPTPAQRKRVASSMVAAAVKPVHRRATSNARRLARKR